MRQEQKILQPAGCLDGYVSLLEFVADPGNRLDDWIVVIGIDFVAQPLDAGPDGVDARITVGMPDPLQERFHTKDFVWMAHKELKQGKLSRQKMDFLAVSCHFVLLPIDCDVPHLQDVGRHRRRGSTQQKPAT